MMASSIEVYNLSRKQRVAVDIMAMSPGITNDGLARQMDMSKREIARWMQNSNFIEAAYDRYIELNGLRLMSVMEAMFREAEEGSVPAAQLVLSHYNKLNNQVLIKMESPFEKFLKAGAIDGEMITVEEAIDIGSSIDHQIELPARNVDNDKPAKRTKAQKKSLKDLPDRVSKTNRKKLDRNYRYQLRVRARSVGLDCLPKGRQPEIDRKRWLNKLEKLEAKRDAEL